MSSFVYNPNANKGPFGSGGTRDVKVNRIEEGLPGDSASFNVLKNASATTSIGSDADLTFTSVLPGPVGNLISVTYVNPGTASAALSVVVQNYYSIVVNLATNGSSVITSTAAQIRAAVEGSAAGVGTINTLPSQLVSVAFAPTQGGTGTVTALAQFFLTGGTSNLATLVNQSLTYTAVDVNQGNDTWVTYINSGPSQSLGVTVQGNSGIVVNLATNSSSVIQSTGTQVKNAVNGYAPAAALVTVTGTNGSAVTALPQTYLTGAGQLTRNTFDAGIAGVGGTEPARQSATVDTSSERITQTTAVTRSNPAAWAGN